MHAIETELLEVTGLKQKPKEKRGAFLTRLVAFDITEKWDTLSADAQSWLNDATKADNADEAIPDFPNSEDAAASDDDAGAAADDEEEKVTTKAKKKAKKAKAAKGNGAEKEAAPKTEKKARVVGPLREGLEKQIKNMIVDEPKISAETLIGALSKKKVKASKFTVVAIRSGFRHSIRVLQERGLIKGKIDL